MVHKSPENKTQENSSKTVANGLSQIHGEGKSALEIIDTRPETIAQRKLQEIANNSMQVKQFNALRQMADNSVIRMQEEAEPRQGKSIPVQIKENKTGLPDDLKTGVENLSGLSMDDVRVHYNSSQPAQLNALAYAQGTDIHVSPGQESHLPHEAWHVVQQAQGRVQPTLQMKEGVSINDDRELEKEADVMGSEAMEKSHVKDFPKDQNPTGIESRPVQYKGHNQGNIIQRDIGFEFESQAMGTKKSNTGPLPNTGFPDTVTAINTYNARTSRRINKGVKILSKADIEVQADDGTLGGTSDLEVVTTHFPTDPGGRNRLDQAMTGLDTLVNASVPFSAATGQIIPATVLNGSGGFTTDMDDAMILGPWNRARTAGQVTMGIRLGNVGNIVKELHGDPNETGGEKISRDPGRLKMRPANPLNALEPRNLAAGSESNTLVDGYVLAKQALQQYQLNEPTAPAGGDALEGLLTIIFSYCESMNFKQSFLKNHTPLMAKTNLATIFTTLPRNVQKYYAKRRLGMSNFQRLVATAPGYNAKMNQPLFAGIPVTQEGDNTLPVDQQWYHNLMLNDWLDAIVSRNRGMFEAIRDGFDQNKRRPGVDKLTNATFPNKPANKEIEGYGALGANMDTDTTTADRLPVFELRSASKMITFAEAHQWALDFFDYVRSLNANPGGGHTLL